MTIVLIISLIIIFAVIILAAITTSKAYKFKHTIDSSEDVNKEQEQKNP